MRHRPFASTRRAIACPSTGSSTVLPESASASSATRRPLSAASAATQQQRRGRRSPAFSTLTKTTRYGVRRSGEGCRWWRRRRRWWWNQATPEVCSTVDSGTVGVPPAARAAASAPTSLRRRCGCGPSHSTAPTSLGGSSTPPVRAQASAARRRERVHEQFHEASTSVAAMHGSTGARADPWREMVTKASSTHLHRRSDPQRTPTSDRRSRLQRT